MTALAQQQQLLLEAILARPAENAIKNIANEVIDPGARGLKGYISNGHALAHSALQAAYPVVAQLLGDDSFADLARALWHAEPPTCGDIAQWGCGLPEFLANSAQLQDEPYLPDVARAEWALHQCAGALDAQPDLASLALLTTHDPAQLHLRLAPGCAVVPSTWPIASILGAHRDGAPSLQEAGAQLRRCEAQSAVVWRAGLLPQVRSAIGGECDFLKAVLQGQPLGDALDASPALDFAQWLPLAVNSGLVLGAIAIDASGELAQN